MLAPAHHDRLSRHILRANVRLSSGATRHSIAFSLEEALRLVTLPGENEGRVYFFRHISLTSISAHAPRSLWIARIQSTLLAHSINAVSGADPLAAGANAVYFHNLDYALETVLRVSLRSSEYTPWFATAVLKLPSGSPAATVLPAILKRLAPPSMPVAAAANILLAATEKIGPIALLNVLPETFIREWLAGFTPSSTNSTIETSVKNLPSSLRTMLCESAEHFGWRQPQTLWLATVAVASIAPSSPPEQIHRRARAMLRQLETSAQTASNPLHSPHAAMPNSAPARLASEEEKNPPSTTTHLLGESVLMASEEEENTPSTTTHLLGEPTQSAGLYFLLHVLRNLGIVAAVHDTPALDEAELPSHILRALALQHGVALADPILLPLEPLQPGFALASEVLSTLPPTAFPGGFPGNLTDLDSRSYLSLWTRAVRRWCVQNARTSVRNIIYRSGHLWLTHTDLDVTLPMSTVDLRIRRCGLDLNPLWLPWLGPTGRVVRFHYTDTTGAV